LLVGRLGGARTARGGHRAAEQGPPAGGGSELKPAAAAARGDESGAPGWPAAARRGSSGQWRRAALRHRARAHGDRGTAAGSSRVASAQNWTIAKVNFSNFLIPYSYFCILGY